MQGSYLLTRLRAAGSKLLDYLYPDSLYCICCGNLIDETRSYALCDHCIRHIKWNREPPVEVEISHDMEMRRGSPAAINKRTGAPGRQYENGYGAFGRQYENGYGAFGCEYENGYGAPDHIMMMRCVEYGIYERTMIFSLKYNGKKYIARDIADMMYDKLMLMSESALGPSGPAGSSIRTNGSERAGRSLDEPDSGSTASQFVVDLIIPVPMNKNKEKKRGFNHAALISKYLAAKMGIDYLPDALMRTRDTRPMRGLSPEERKENVRGAFALDTQYSDRIRGQRIMILDDFFTTGSTATECVRALSSAGPASVLFYAFAAR